MFKFTIKNKIFPCLRQHGDMVVCTVGPEFDFTIWLGPFPVWSLHVLPVPGISPGTLTACVWTVGGS